MDVLRLNTHLASLQGIAQYTNVQFNCDNLNAESDEIGSAVEDNTRIGKNCEAERSSFSVPIPIRQDFEHVCRSALWVLKHRSFNDQRFDVGKLLAKGIEK
jgi:hypothetical protein